MKTKMIISIIVGMIVFPLIMLSPEIISDFLKGKDIYGIWSDFLQIIKNADGAIGVFGGLVFGGAMFGLAFWDSFLYKRGRS